MTSRSGRAAPLETLAIVFLLIAAAAFLAQSFRRSWDFQVFHAAAVAVLSGDNPYHLRDLARAAGHAIDLPFVYPPVTLALFAPLARLPVAVAERLWLTLEIGLAAALVLLWRRRFVPEARPVLLVAVALLGFNAALLWDLRVRNVTALEQFVLWSAFASYLDGRSGRFALLVALGAVFKLLAIAFLVLLLVPGPNRRARSGWAAVGVLAFAALVFLPLLVGPPWTRDFLRNLPAERPVSEINPCALGLIDDLLGPWSATRAGTATVLSLWAAYALALLAASRGLVARVWCASDPIPRVMLAAVLFTLLSPRMIVYSYVLMVAPALWLVARLFPNPMARAVVWGLVLVQGALQLVPGIIDWGYLGYLPWFVTLGLWLAWRRAASRGTPVAESAGGAGRVASAALIAVMLCGLVGCAPRRPASHRSSLTWFVGRSQPAFDPEGPPDATRWALERLLTHGLMREDSSGTIVPAAARSVDVSRDSLVYTFHLPGDLAFTDGSRCPSASFRDALVAGLARPDHATRAWLLSAVRGVDQVRPGRALPELGIETPDDSTLVMRLARPDRALLEKLALPGVSAPFASREGTRWGEARGLGPYRVVSADSTRRLVLVRRTAREGAPDTLLVRFATGAARGRAMLRRAPVDLAWPLAPGLLDEELPAGFRVRVEPARPPRRLLLVMRADLPPTSKLPARHALAHGLDRPALLRALGREGVDFRQWLPGAKAFDFPRLDVAESRRWMEEGKFRRSFHVTMAYDADGVPAEVALELQGEWARASIYAELEPLRGEALEWELLRGRAHLVLVDAQRLLADPVSELAALVMPLRGSAVGSFRTGWRTRELDAWLIPGPDTPPFPAAEVQRQLEEQRLVVPLANLPWVWVESDSRTFGVHPRYGPDVAGIH